ncbi:endonuclease domain-containing 1 protein [Anolis carolinensis]|uniref:Endonuclease domain containing 1 n=1 Tax=Anolis carolinensis TaxID=28377 RepID=G1KPC6_ANOCA|nr:PREDICTED: endonuclease domain-containing 1 protein [Anolis carolinensis]|eukprot:XP_008106287.1 PREDICTED: endonuclease domain-containing 1 protein [Anolis carolinensis]
MGLSHLLPCLSLVALLVALPGPSRSEVIAKEEAGFGDCDAFFYQKTPPEGFQHFPKVVKICQKYHNQPHFATLYSTQDRIPLYSAFRYQEATQCCPEEASWMVEPQIDDHENGLAGMMPEAEIADSVNNLGTNQALTSDYIDSGYEAGQLNPSSLQKDDHQLATHSLTNTFPVKPPLQDVWHWEIENLVSHGLAPHCANGKDLYLISGAVPSSHKVNDKVAIPESLWLAACCDDGSNAWSMGFIKEAAAEKRLEDLSVEELEKKLPEGTRLFKNNCAQDRHDPKKLEPVAKSVKKIQGEKPAPQSKKSLPMPHQAPKEEECGFMKKLFYFVITPICRLLTFAIYMVVQILKFILYIFTTLLHMVITGLCTFLKSIATVLMHVFTSLIRVLVNIMNGLARNIYRVLMVVYRIVCVPLNLLVDILSFPFYVLGAVPALLHDIAAGVSGLFMLLINGITNFVKCLSWLVTHIAKSILPHMST